MGIAANLMLGLIEEARFKPFSGTSCTFGRQTMGMTPEAVLDAFRRAGLKPASGVDLKIDTQTLAAKNGRGGLILDHSFFSLLGFDRTVSADVSNFEGAEIVIDLNKPVANDQEGICDFLADGSLLDNIFDPVTGLKNIARMLRPGGRALIIDLGNSIVGRPGTPYTILTGAWFYDFFTVNEWEDVQVFACCYHPTGVATYMIDPKYLTRQVRPRFLSPMGSDVPMAIVTFVEKGRHSTWDRVPTQHVYRPDEEWPAFEATINRYRKSRRPPLLRSTMREAVDKVSPGWNFIAPDGTVHQTYNNPKPVPPAQAPAAFAGLASGPLAAGMSAKS